MKKKIVHIIEIQYFRGYSTNSKNTYMHDLKASYEKVFKILNSVAKENFAFGQNHRFYPNPSVMSDLEIVSLAITAECLGITSENLLWSKIKKDYPELFPNLVHRATFNRRRESLRGLILQCTEVLANCLVEDDEPFIIDSIPIPTCKIIRERSSRACRREKFDEVIANKGFNHILGGYFIGYKMHIITTSSGVYRDLLITSGSVHDSEFLRQITHTDQHLRNREMLCDRAYIGPVTQLRLFDEVQLNLTIPYRRNQKDFKKYDPAKRETRKTIEVVFSQYCDEFSIRTNYAKRFNGFDIRIITKIAAKTFKQYWNHIHGRPINQTKHSLAA